VIAPLHIPGRTVKEFLASSSVSPAANADVLTFRVGDTNADLAVRMARTYAARYRAYRLQFDTQAIRTARERVQQRISSPPSKEGALYASLVDHDQQLSTMEALLTSQVAVIGTPTSAPQVSPRAAATPKQTKAVLQLTAGHDEYEPGIRLRRSQPQPPRTAETDLGRHPLVLRAHSAPDA
jgi:hypothetical protein